MEEKLSLHADDALLYLNDAGLSLSAALEIFDTFGSFFGIRINWSKSILFPIDRPIDLAPSSPLQWVEEFRYLGVQVTRRISEFFDRNFQPLLTSLKRHAAHRGWGFH